MKVLVLNAQQSQGVSDKSGVLKPYHMATITYLVPLEDRIKRDEEKGTSYRMNGYGLQAVEMSLDPEHLGDFSKVNFPALMDIATEARPMFGKVQTFCIGAVSVAVRAAAAA